MRESLRGEIRQSLSLLALTAGTAAVLRTAPTPVVTQQPISAAAPGSTPSGSGIAAAAGTTDASAIVAMAQ